MSERKFRIARWFIVANYFMIVFFFLFALLFVYVTVSSMNSMKSSSIVMFILAAIGFIAAGIYSIKILPRLRETVSLSEEQIVIEHTDGTITAITWLEDFRVRNRPFLGRMDLISQDGRRVINLEQQLSGYDEIINYIGQVLREKQEKRPG